MAHRKDTTDPLTRVLRAYTTVSQLSKVLGVSIPTAHKKLTDPERLTVGELRKLKKVIPVNFIREGI